jgi:hypothetical protein
MIAVFMCAATQHGRRCTAAHPPDRAPHKRKVENSTVFTANMTLPVNRWFRYSAGFSATWAEQAIRTRMVDHQETVVLDPFVGSGTTLIASQAAGARAIGLESHPFVARVARAKLAWGASPDELERRAARVLASARPSVSTDPPVLLARIYPQHTLAQLAGLRNAVDSEQKGDAVDDLVWLALVAILRACSPVGTAQWQYVLPNKKKAKTAEPLDAFAKQIRMMASDMRRLRSSTVSARVFQEDARVAPSVSDGSVGLVVTSPPYPNNYDYADATRVEMTFLGQVERWRDLQDTVRSHLVRSCSQHMVGYEPDEALEAPEIAPIRDELHATYRRLSHERKLRPGHKAYDAMIVAYFHDLARTWMTLQRVCEPGGQVLFIIGDSAPYAVHVPVERWLGELALGAGFRKWRFEKLRDRNIKWKNRKHRVPLHEGLLTVEN